jgi:hypothetical protein
MKHFLFLILLSSSLSVAHAQSKTAIRRQGFVFGTSVGAANSFQKFPGITRENTDFALALKAGYMLNQNLAVLLTTNVSGYDYDGTGSTRVL